MMLPASDTATARVPRLPFDGCSPRRADTRADALARFENDEAFLERIVPLFIQSAREQSAALTVAIRRGDPAQVQHWAHTLKGSLLTVGAAIPAARAGRIEQQAARHRLDGLSELIALLVAETTLVVEHLEPSALPAGA